MKKRLGQVATGAALLVCLLFLGGMVVSHFLPVDHANYFDPGSAYSVKREIGFYVARLPASQASALADNPSAVSDKDKKDALEGSDSYVPLPPEATSGLVLDGKWSAPKGMTVSNPQVTISPAKLSWTDEEWFGTMIVDHTWDGQVLLFSYQVTVDADASPVRGKIEVTLPNFSQLEAAGLYVLASSSVSRGTDFMTGANNVYLLADRPRYAADTTVFSLGDVAIRPTSTASTSNAPAPSTEKLTYKLDGTATGADITYSDGAGQGPLQRSGVAVPLTRASDHSPGIVLPASHGAHVSFTARSTHATGNLTCSIEVDGRVLDTESSSGPNAAVTCSAAIP